MSAKKTPHSMIGSLENKYLVTIIGNNIPSHTPSEEVTLNNYCQETGAYVSGLCPCPHDRNSFCPCESGVIVDTDELIFSTQADGILDADHTTVTYKGKAIHTYKPFYHNKDIFRSSASPIELSIQNTTKGKTILIAISNV